MPFVKITRNKKIEAKNDKMMEEHYRYLAVIRYLQLRAAGEDKMKASANEGHIRGWTRICPSSTDALILPSRAPTSFCHFLHLFFCSWLFSPMANESQVGVKRIILHFEKSISIYALDY